MLTFFSYPGRFSQECEEGKEKRQGKKEEQGMIFVVYLYLIIRSGRFVLLLSWSSLPL